jgi:hypothetical protein
MNASFLDRELPSDLLREFAKLALHEIARLNEEIAKLKALSVDQEQLGLSYRDQLSRLQEKMFGRGGEKFE